MAENLLAHNSQGVLKRVIRSRRVFSDEKIQQNTELENAIQSMINAVREDERALYKRLGVNNYRSFLDKMNSIRTSDLNYLLTNGEVVKYYIRNYIFPTGHTQDEAIDYLRALLEENFESLSVLIKEDFVDNGFQDITSEAREFIRQEFTGKKGYLRYFGKSGKAVGVGKLQFGLTREKKNGVMVPKINVSLQQGATGLSKELIAKIIAKLQPKQVLSINQAFPNKNAFLKDVEFIILRVTPAAWKESIARALSGKLGSIDISRSYAGLVGYLGEVRAVAILHRLFGDAATATGSLKEEAINSPQISIDAIVKMGFNYLGFQVKNYTLSENGKATFSKTMTSLNFINNRLCLTGELGEFLSDLFGVYQFNQPFEDASLRKRFENTDKPVEWYENTIYTQAEQAINSLSGLFESRMGNMLRIGHNFKLEIDNETDSSIAKIFRTPKDYYNSFWFIEGEFIPSSVILEGILEQIKSGQLQDLTKVNYSITNNTNMTLENNYIRLPKLNDVLLSQKIRYNVVLDVHGLKNKALQRI